MSLGIKTDRLAEIYFRIMQSANYAHDIAARIVGIIDQTNVPQQRLTDEIVPWLYGAYTQMPDPADYSAQFLTQIRDYVNTQVQTANPDFSADYLALRNAVGAALQEAARIVPKTGGKITVLSFNPDGSYTSDPVTDWGTLRDLCVAVQTAAN